VTKKVLLFALLVFASSTPAFAQADGFVYALQDVNGATNQIYGFSVNSATGVLTALPGFPVSSQGIGSSSTLSEALVYDPASARLYALNEGDSSVGAFAVNRLTGALTPLAYSPLVLPPPTGVYVCLAVSPDGKILAAASADSGGAVASYVVTATSAVSAPGSPVSTTSAAPYSCLFSRDGRYFYTGGNTGRFLATFSVDGATGGMTMLSGSPIDAGSSPAALAADSLGRIFSGAGSTLRAFTTAGGSPSPVTGNPFTGTGQTSVFRGIVARGSLYITADRAAHVGVFRISGTGSATTLTPVTGSPYASGGLFTDTLAVDQAESLLFAGHGNSRNITTFRVGAADPVLASLWVQPVNSLGATGRVTGLAYAPPITGGFVYVLRNNNGVANQLYGFSVNQSTGALSALAGFPIALAPGTNQAFETEGLVYDPRFLRLYVLNPGNATISAFSVNRATGALTALPFGPIVLTAGRWQCLAVSPDGTVLVAGNYTSVVSFAASATGLTAAPGGAVTSSSPFSCAFSRDGRYFYAGGTFGTVKTVSGYAVNGVNGALTPLTGSPFDTGDGSPVGYATDGSGRLFMANIGGKVRAFTTSDGIPTAVAGNPFASGLFNVVHGILTPSGHYLAGEYSGLRIGSYAVGGSGSATTLAPVIGSPFSAGIQNVAELAIDDTGTLVFADGAGTNNISTIGFDPATGGLTRLAVQPANTLGSSLASGGLVFVPQGGASRITEITSAGQPRGITGGPDGNVWFTEFIGNKIGRITPAGVITEFATPTASGPDGITTGPDGNLWYAGYYGNKIGKVTPSGTITEFAGPGGPALITSGSDGNLWFTEFDSAKIGRITPAGAVTEFSAGITAGSVPYGITSGPDGNLWFTEYVGNKVGRITPSGTVTEFPLPVVGSGPAAIVAGPDGALWFAELGGTPKRIGRITTGGTITEFAGLSAGTNGIALGPDNNLWFSSNSGVGKITTSGAVTEYPAPSAGFFGAFITSGPDGNIWYTDQNNSKIDVIVLSRFGLAVSKSGTGSGTVSSAPAGISCGATCGAHLVDDTTLVLTATAATGSRFAGWSGAGCSGTGPCLVTVGDTTFVTATFNQQYRLTVIASGVGTISSNIGGISCGSTCSAVVDAGTVVTLTETPGASRVFHVWDVSSGTPCGSAITCQVTVNSNLTVIGSFTFSISPAQLPPAVAGTPYLQSLTPSAGHAPFSFVLAAGSLPAGISLSPSGVFSGTPTAFGPFNINLFATDFDGFIGTASYTLTVSCPAITVAPSVLPTLVIRTPYSQSISQTGGVGAATFSVSSGVLPPGLSLSSSGALTGQPSVEGQASFTITATDSIGCTGTRTYSPTVSGLPTMSLSLSAVNFGAVTAGAAPWIVQTPSQALGLTQNGPGTVTWTAAADQPWIKVSPTSGSGAASLTIAVLNTGAQPGAGLLSGAVTITSTGAANSPSATVNLSLFAGTAAAPIGVFDTPADGGAALQGSIAVTGWALDDVAIDRVELWRDVAPGETTPPFVSTPSDPRNGKVFVGNGAFVAGARPDVEALSPLVPLNYRAGWGYLLLTWGLWNQGNSTFTLYAYAFDVEGKIATLGKKTIGVANAQADRPFGSIDTPGIGGTASGTVVNFGWGLTPKVGGAATCKIQPSGVQVSIDSGPLQPVAYGDARTDIAGAFTGFSNTSTAGGHYVFDSTLLSNGAHTIGWLITDDCNRADGVGSRFFNVQNGSLTAAVAVSPGLQLRAAEVLGDSDLPVTVAHGFGELPTTVSPDTSGVRIVGLAQGDRVEISVPRGYDEVHQEANGRQRALPAGATWDADGGILYWQPASGFLGSFDLLFANGNNVIRVRVVVEPR
jgi:streptogramin lyase/6-phosphogluconolactonase (cycloisomerase 2 family)